jgi:hypothetical protein
MPGYATPNERARLTKGTKIDDYRTFSRYGVIRKLLTVLSRGFVKLLLRWGGEQPMDVHVLLASVQTHSYDRYFTETRNEILLFRYVFHGLRFVNALCSYCTWLQTSYITGRESNLSETADH